MRCVCSERKSQNHLGSTMMVAKVSCSNANAPADVAAADDYRAFGELVDLTVPAEKVTENFTGICPQVELDENTLVYFHCRVAGHSALRKSKGLKISYDWIYEKSVQVDHGL